MPKYFDLEVSLVGIKPRIWRRFLITVSGSFRDLHAAVQFACGWGDAHLFRFLDPAGKKSLAGPEYEDPFSEQVVPVAERVRLCTYFTTLGDSCQYVYDFGDNWQHLVELKGIRQVSETFGCQLLDGARAFPPEDCGGIWGYEDCCRIAKMSDKEIKQLSKKDKDEATWRKEWLGNWDPERFDIEDVKKFFDR